MPKGSAGGLGGGSSPAFGGRGFGGGPSPEFRPPGQAPALGGGPSFEESLGLGSGSEGQPLADDGGMAPPAPGADRMPPVAPPSGRVDAGYGVGPLDAQGTQAPTPSSFLSPPAQAPSMPAGIPPPAPILNPAAKMSGSSMQGGPTGGQKLSDKLGGAPVGGAGPATVGMSPAKDAQTAMMSRANVKPLGATGSGGQGGIGTAAVPGVGGLLQNPGQKRYPAPRVPPGPRA